MFWRRGSLAFRLARSRAVTGSCSSRVTIGGRDGYRKLSVSVIGVSGLRLGLGLVDRLVGWSKMSGGNWTGS